MATASVSRLGRAAAVDNVGVTAVIVTSAATLPMGTSTVTWTARDAAGNSGTATQVVTVIDVESPTIVAPPPVVIWLPEPAVTAANVDLGTPASQDNVGVTLVGKNAPATFPLGVTDVTWTAQDAAGHTATAVQRVDVRQGVAGPVAYLTSPGDGISFLAGSTLTLTAAVAAADVSDIDRVEFQADDQMIGESRTAPWRYAWANAPAGDHRLQAIVRFRHQDHSPLPASVTSDVHTVHVVTPDQVQGGQP